MFEEKDGGIEIKSHAQALKTIQEIISLANQIEPPTSLKPHFTPLYPVPYITGLPNPHSYICYLNANIQCLVATPSFTEYFEVIEPKEEEKVICAFKRVFEVYRSGDREECRKAIITLQHSFHSDFFSNEYMCAAEFFRLVMVRLEEEFEKGGY